MATLPAGHPPSCHAKDTACLARLGPSERKDRKRRWWLTQHTGSAWLAARPHGSGGGGGGGGGGGAACTAPPTAAAPRAAHEKHLVAWTELRDKTGASHPPPAGAPPATLGALPRSSVGRLCGARLAVPPLVGVRVRADRDHGPIPTPAPTPTPYPHPRPHPHPHLNPPNPDPSPLPSPGAAVAAARRAAAAVRRIRRRRRGAPAPARAAYAVHQG